MIASNVVILSLDAARFTRSFVNDTRFSDVFCTTSPNAALDHMRHSRTDILVLERTLPGYDGQRFLTELHMRVNSCCLPRVLLLQRFCEEMPSICDGIAPIDLCPVQIVDKAYALWGTPFPALCRTSVESRKQLTADILKQLKMPETFAGYQALVFGSAVLSCCNRNDLPLRQWLYPHIALQTGSTISCVERNLRTLVDHTWLKGNLETIQLYFGTAYDAEKGKPTNACVLHTLAQHIRANLNIQ